MVKKVLICFALLCALSSPALLGGIAHAQALVTSTNGSAGTIVAAALESAGYAMQSAVLKDLSLMLLKAAVLISVILMIFGISTFVITKSYDRALWFLIGPTLFFFLIRSTTIEGGAEWRFGTFNNTRELVSVIGSIPKSEVSWFFHQYNKFISNIYQQIIGVITSKDSEFIMKKFLTREKILADLLSMRIQDGGLVTVSVEALSQCSREMDAARHVALGERDRVFRGTATYTNALAFFTKNYQQQTKFISQTASKDYLRELLTQIENGTVSGTRACIQQTSNRIFTSGGVDPLLNSAVSCEELWCWMTLGVEREVAMNQINSGIRYGLDAQTYKRLSEDIAKKLETPHQVYDYEKKPLFGVTPVQPDDSLIPTIIGGHLIKGMLQQINIHSGMLSNITSNAGIEMPQFNATTAMSPENVRQAVNFQTGHNLAEIKRYEIIAFAMLVPYLQGIILYTLSVLFPFFALMVLIPGQSRMIFLWMGLWAWAKSWDVGWALLMCLEDFFWNIMPNTSIYDQLKDPNHGPISVFEAAFAGDVSYGLATYFAILGALITAVPVFSAQLMIGGANSIIRPLFSGISNFSGVLGMRLGLWTAVEQQMRSDGIRDNFMLHYMKDNLGKDNPNNKMAPEMRKTIGALRARANEFRSMGMVTGPQLLALGIGNWGALGQIELSGKDAAIAYEQWANAMEAELARGNAAFYFWDSLKTEEYATQEHLRAAASERLVHWKLPASPPSQAYLAQTKSVIGGVLYDEYGNTGLRVLQNTAPLKLGN